MKFALKYNEDLKEAGFTNEESKAVLQVWGEVMESQLITKEEFNSETNKLRSEMKELGTELRSEMKELGTKLRSEMKELGTELRSEMKELRTELRSEFQSGMKDLEVKLTLRLGIIMMAGVTLLGFINHWTK